MKRSRGERGTEMTRSRAGALGRRRRPAALPAPLAPPLRSDTPQEQHRPLNHPAARCPRPTGPWPPAPPPPAEGGPRQRCADGWPRLRPQPRYWKMPCKPLQRQ